jgi:hypothetical protein
MSSQDPVLGMNPPVLSICLRLQGRHRAALLKRARAEGKPHTSLATELLISKLSRSTKKGTMSDAMPEPIRKALGKLAIDAAMPPDKVLVELVASLLICISAESAQSMLAGKLGYEDLRQAIEKIKSGEHTPMITSDEAESSSRAVDVRKNAPPGGVALVE